MSPFIRTGAILTGLPLDNRQVDIAKMECELLYGKFDDATTTAEGVELIGSIPGGNSAHCAAALKMGLREGLLGGVFLRCPRSECDLHKNSASCRSLGSSIKGARNAPKATCYLECSGCGTSQTSSEYTSCQGCKKRFRQSTIPPHPFLSRSTVLPEV